jgi:AcrR family transcriptional regulator
VTDRADASPPLSLGEEHQDLTRARIRAAAMKVVARHGFNATVEEIAQESGVSARTIFRHYTTHDRLIASTVVDMFEACGRGPIEGLPRSAEDFDGWLEGLASTIHFRNAEIVGAAFWDIHTSRLRESESLMELATTRRESRIRGVNHLATHAWRAAGGIGEPSEAVVMAFGLNFSAFTTQALMVDFEQTPDQIGKLTAHILKMLVRREVQHQRDTADDGRR